MRASHAVSKGAVLHYYYYSAPLKLRPYGAIQICLLLLLLLLLQVQPLGSVTIPIADTTRSSQQLRH